MKLKAHSIINSNRTKTKVLKKWSVCLNFHALRLWPGHGSWVLCTHSPLGLFICYLDAWTPSISSLHFSVQFHSVTQSCLTLCDPLDCSTPGFPVHHQLLELAQTHVHQVSDAIQSPHPLPSPSPPAFNLSQHQGLFQWVSYLHQVAKVLEVHFYYSPYLHDPDSGPSLTSPRYQLATPHSNPALGSAMLWGLPITQDYIYLFYWTFSWMNPEGP